jgi:hypothetical protein
VRKHYKLAQAAQRSIRLRHWEKLLSVCAVSLFVLWYLPVVVYIVALCGSH